MGLGPVVPLEATHASTATPSPAPSSAQEPEGSPGGQALYSVLSLALIGVLVWVFARRWSHMRYLQDQQRVQEFYRERIDHERRKDTDSY